MYQSMLYANEGTICRLALLRCVCTLGSSKKMGAAAARAAASLAADLGLAAAFPVDAGGVTGVG